MDQSSASARGWPSRPWAAGLEPGAGGARDRRRSGLPAPLRPAHAATPHHRKVEMVYEGEQHGSEVVARRLVGQAVRKIFDERFPRWARSSAAAARTTRVPTPASCAGSPRQCGDDLGRAVVRRYETELSRVSGPHGPHEQARSHRQERALPPRWPWRAPPHLKLARNDLDSRSATRKWSSSSSSSRARTSRRPRKRGDIN